MRTLFLVACALTGWWIARDWEPVGQIGVIVVFTLLGVLALALSSIVRAVAFGLHAVHPRHAHPWQAEDDDEVKQSQRPIDWVPVLGSPEDPQRNLWHSPDHQNPIDPDRWL